MADEISIKELRKVDATGKESSQPGWRETMQARMVELVKQGNQSHLVLQRSDRQIADIPLTAVAALGLVGLVTSPFAVAAAVVAAVLSRVNARIDQPSSRVIEQGR